MAASSGPVNGGGPSGGPLSVVEANGVGLQQRQEGEASPVEEDVLYLTDKLPHSLPLDALPYVDPLPAEQQQEIQRLLQQEMAAIAQEGGGGPDAVPDYLKDLPIPSTPMLDDAESLLGKEFARKARGENEGRCRGLWVY